MRIINNFWNKPFVAGSAILSGLIAAAALLFHFIWDIHFAFFLALPLLILVALILDRYFCRVPMKFGLKVLSCLIFYPLCAYRRWDRITSHLYLGALPLLKHLPKLVKKEKIASVLSMTEEFELETHGLFFKPINSRDWALEGVHHQIIEAKDCTKLTEGHIEKAVRFIAQEIEKGRKVYVHCQAGIERSVTVVAAYLLHAGIVETIKESIAYLREFRPNAVLTKRNEQALKKWFENHHKVKGIKWLYEQAKQKLMQLKERL